MHYSYEPKVREAHQLSFLCERRTLKSWWSIWNHGQNGEWDNARSVTQKHSDLFFIRPLLPVSILG